MEINPLWLLVTFLLGCCVGIAPWHWLALRANRLLDECRKEVEKQDQLLSAFRKAVEKQDQLLAAIRAKGE